MKKGIIVGLANHTVLIRRDGTEIPIDDSGAPIKDKEGKIHGCCANFPRLSASSRRAENKLEEYTKNLEALVEEQNEAA